ncbi:MAG: hypothetical protein JWO00_465 [Candidatus Parcubacteria bacterium]|nr:hypothetical protein [Candidatus Parcubacteria bacterium]
MTDNNQLALIVAYYLSRCDKNAYKNLGYLSFNQATREISKILNVKVNTIKNMRDEFDPHHENQRIGWLRDLKGSRLKVLKLFQDTSDESLLEVVRGILFDHEFKNSEDYRDIETILSKNESDQKSIFILRGPTGRKAELFFIAYFNKYKIPFDGELIDKRDDGCGYDFEIKNNSGLWFFEVKGLAANDGGILFTNKEWNTAIKNQEKYFLVVVKNLSTIPEIFFLNNPTKKLEAKRNIYTTVQVSWSVSSIKKIKY